MSIMGAVNPFKKRRDYTALIEELLGDYSVKRVEEGRFRSCCPLHGGDNPTAFSIRTDGAWKCWKGCGSGGMKELLVRMTGVSPAQAEKVLETMPAVFHSLGELSSLFDGKAAPKRLREAEVTAYEGKCPRYLLSRGFSKASLREYGIGYDDLNRKIIIPARDAGGRLVGITYRADKYTNENEPKYWHDHFIKTEHLWGFYKVLARAKQGIIKDLYLTEGQLDVVRMFQLGHHATAIMGSAISEPQVELLINSAKSYARLILAFDNDDAGRKATLGAVNRLSKTPLGRRLYLAKYPTDDPGELREYHHIQQEPWYDSIMGYVPSTQRS